MTRLSVGAFYNPHLAEALLASCDRINHLALADTPYPNDRWWPKIQQGFTLLVHDYLGQLSEPFSSVQLARARRLADQSPSPGVGELPQRFHPPPAADAGVPDFCFDYVF